ncbi:hypothetical protein IMCC3088_2697 [Aequoribacter fuscus]|uniref:Uncharacterized protein n=1 Tax=Aequoribacter fuscus TaxID=2518989 RepID=F3KYY0_9GAMM|nr:hypothetical protein IMCC3088_2697 [Aequoribacter fuscus]
MGERNFCALIDSNPDSTTQLTAPSGAVFACVASWYKVTEEAFS